MTLKDMINNPNKRFWDKPKDVEIDPKVKLEKESGDLIQIAKDRLQGRTTLGMSGDMGKFTEMEIRWITARATDIVNQKEGWNARDHWILACRMAEREVVMRRFKGE